MFSTKIENIIKAGETFEQLMEKIKAKFPEVESNIKLISESFRGSYEIVQSFCYLVQGNLWDKKMLNFLLILFQQTV